LHTRSLTRSEGQPIGIRIRALLHLFRGGFGLAQQVIQLFVPPYSRSLSSINSRGAGLKRKD